MPFKKFENRDLFYNTIKAKPRFEIKIWGGKAIVNNGSSEAILNGGIAPTNGCSDSNSFDFSCLENSYNIGII